MSQAHASFLLVVNVNKPNRNLMSLFCIPLYIPPIMTCHIFDFFHFKLWLFYKK